MNVLALLEAAMEARGNAVAVLACTDPANTTVLYANGCFGAITGLWAGDRLDALRPGVADEPQWAALTQALAERAPVQIDLRLQRPSEELWFGFGLSFREDAPGAVHAIVVGRDITRERRAASQENGTRRMLAAVFMRIAAPVTIVQADGHMLMSNPAFQRLLGYGAEELVGLDPRAITAAECNEAVETARTRQLQDGAPFELPIVVLARDGRRLPVRLSSVLLGDGDQRLRVVTLMPYTPVPPADLAAAVSRAMLVGPLASSVCPGIGPAVGQVEVVSLAAFHAALGPEWPNLALRAMLRAEQIIKRRLTGADVTSRSGAHDFVIWFESADAARNAQVLETMVREIRLGFVTEFGDAVAAHVGAMIAPQTMSGPDSRADPRLMAELRATTVTEARPVTGRDGQAKGIVLVDFDAALRRRIRLQAEWQPDPKRDAEIDRLRLDLALQELGAVRGAGHVMTAISWHSLTTPEDRGRLDTRLARLGSEPRARLVLAVTDVPPLPSAKRWTDATAALRGRIAEVALMLRLADPTPPLPAQIEAMIAEWPLTLLAIDGADDDRPPPDTLHRVIAAARRRDLAVLACVDPATMHDWRELGATLFA